ncbi:MAG TPA: mannitol dehydrogenase family protein [bacterium]|nr:mannitol dehydrogenase family protein [bacterium]
MGIGAMRLSRATLASLPNTVVRPRHDVAQLCTGIVHLGLGAFHRAHQAVYTASVLAEDPRWGILGVSPRHAATRDALAPQDWFYTVATRDESGERLEVIGALTGVLVLPEDPRGLIARMAMPDVRVVTVTVTERGYCRAAASGDLDETDATIRHDLATPGAPRSMPGVLVAALRARRTDSVAPFTLLSCDNLPANGATLRRVLLQYASLTDRDLACWIEEHVAFPSSMVDRIVPPTTSADRARVTAALGVEDAWPVITEPFTQWVVEDRFPGGRPAWETAGATMVADVRPWEEMKLRLLNGSHSSIAYLGQLAGWPTVDVAIRDPALAGHIRALMAEIAPTLSLPPGVDLAGYRDTLMRRFANHELQHLTARIAEDGTQKLPQRLLAPARALLAEGHPPVHIALAVAAWIRFCQGRADGGSALPLHDPRADQVRALAASSSDPEMQVRATLGLPDLGALDLGARDDFVALVAAAVRHLAERGVRNTLRSWPDRTGT